MTTPHCNIDIYSDWANENSTLCYSQMLALGPVVWLEKNNLHAICGFEALTTSIRNHRVFRSGAGVSINDEVNKVLIGSTLHSDPPQHDKTRAITFAPLTPKALQDVKDRIQREAEYIADKMVEQGSFDAAADLAPHIPLTIVRDLVGLGDKGKAHMLDWGAATFELMGDPKDRRQSAVDRLGQLRAFLDDPETLDGLSEDGWARRATKRGIDDGIAPERAVELMRDYIAPSLDTTISAIGYGIHLFSQNPDQWTKLRADRSLIKNAIEEIVRLNTPIRAFSRLVSEDIQVAGVNLKQDERVLMIFGAANRDPSQFPEPDRFDIERSTRGHVGFGHGVHACLGMHLARLEMTLLFDALADRVERFSLTGVPVVAKNSSIHAYSNVPVEVKRCP